MTEEQKKELLTELACRAEKLASLLRDPHEGLWGWCAAVAENAQYLHDWWSGKMVKP